MGYHAKKKLGQFVPPVAHSVVKTVNAKSGGKRREFKYYYVYKPWPHVEGPVFTGVEYYWEFHSFGLIASEINAVMANAYTSASNNLHKNIQNAKEIDAGVILIELRETLGMIGNAALTISETLKHLKNRRFRQAVLSIWNHSTVRRVNGRTINQLDFANKFERKYKRLHTSDVLANSWLELQFGWLPLLQDIYKVIDILGPKVEPNTASTVLGFHGYATKESSNCVQSASPPNTTMNSQKTIVKSGYHAYYRISNPTLYRLNTLGLINPASIAWEIVPFSFVADWFLPIGDYLESLTEDAGLTLIGSCRNIRVSSVAEGQQVQWVSPTNNTGGWCYEGKNNYSHDSFKREVNISIPALSMKATDVIDLVDGWHAATSISLLKQLLK